VDVVVVRGTVVAMATVELVVLVVVMVAVVVVVVMVVVVVVVAAGVPVPVTTADMTALQSTDWYLGIVRWSMRPSRGRR